MLHGMLPFSLALAFSIALITSAKAADSLPAAIVTINPKVDARALGSVETLRHLATGGFTPSYKAGHIILETLKADGIMCCVFRGFHMLELAL